MKYYFLSHSEKIDYLGRLLTSHHLKEILEEKLRRFSSSKNESFFQCIFIMINLFFRQYRAIHR